MLSNNAEKLKLIMTLPDMFDYDAFACECQKSDIAPLRLSEYAQKVGMLKMGMVKFPEIQPAEAYMKIVALMNEDYQKEKIIDPRLSPDSDKRDCNGCGGGKVR